MARKKTVKNEEEEFEVDEPSEVDEGANDDGQNDTNSGSGGAGRRTSGRSRTVKKPYRGEDSTPDEDEDEDGESEEEDKKPKKRGSGAGGGRGGGRGRGRGRGGSAKPPPKKQKLEEENEDSEEDEGDESDGDAADTPTEFRSGCFVALKTDIDNKVENHPVWKIDGKSLLQKFDRFIHEGETLFKSTTIYAGWSKTILETYYPIKVEYKKVPGHDSCVKFDPSQMVNVGKDNKENNKEKELKEEKNDDKKEEEEEEDEDDEEEEDGK